MRETVGVSVVIPCYRCADTIERAVDSVYAQTRLPAEVILVDDYSGDGTLALLHRIKKAHPEGWIKVIEANVNGGAGTARNLGWAAATQPFIAFLDADDSWHPQKIEIQHGWMQAHPEAALTGHACQQTTDKNAATDMKADYSDRPATFHQITKRQILLSNRFSTPAVMLRRELAFRFANGKRYSEDFLLWAEICCSGQPCYRTELPLAYLFKAPYGEGGLSAQLWNMEKGQLGTYVALFRRGHFGRFGLSLLAGLSMAKFVRRVLIQMKVS